MGRGGERAFAWSHRRWGLVAGLALVLAAGAGLTAWLSVEPSNARTWRPDQAMLPRAELDGRHVRIRGVRNFSWITPELYVPAWDDRTFDLDGLESAWFVLTPLSKTWRGPAHSFLSFGFADSQFVAISVEARKEPGETYSVLKGLLKRFELIYVVGDERDLIGLRVAAGEQVFVYPIRAPHDKIRQLFVDMLERANDLVERPEFYNTLTSNCTTNIVRHVNRVAPKRIPYGPRILLPGYADALAYDLGLLATELPLEQARRRYHVNERAKRYTGRPDFSLRIRDASGDEARRAKTDSPG